MRRNDLIKFLSAVILSMSYQSDLHNPDLEDNNSGYMKLDDELDQDEELESSTFVSKDDTNIKKRHKTLLPVTVAGLNEENEIGEQTGNNTIVEASIEQIKMKHNLKLITDLVYDNAIESC